MQLLLDIVACLLPIGMRAWQEWYFRTYHPNPGQPTLVVAGFANLYRILPLLLLAAPMALFVEPFATMRWSLSFSARAILGLPLAIAACMYLYESQRELGQYWSGDVQLREGHQLIKTGPYALVRHPMYTSIIIAGCSLVVLTANHVVAFLVFIYSAACVVKATNEDSLLAHTYGEEYKLWAERTGTFFPKI